MSTIYFNRYGTPFKIIEFIDGTHVVVEFQDEHKIQVRTVIEAALKGSVKNPYDKTIVGTGYIGVRDYEVGSVAPIQYHRWWDMINRCYHKDDDIAYKFAPWSDCSVCEEWHNYQNFAKWYLENEYECKERLQIDKDILLKGNKIYSPKTCLLVPQRINMIFMTCPRKYDSDLPTGIHRTKSSKKYMVQYNTKHLGTYDSLEKCIEIYNDAKMKHVHKVAEEYKNIVPEIVYNALMNW